MKTIKFLITFSIALFLIFLVSAISLTEIYPTSDITTNSSWVNITKNITTDYMNSTTWSWDGTNYSIYDNSLVLFMNFDNRSALGENDTHVKDLSKYGNNGTVVGGSNISWTPNGKYGGAFNFSGNKNTITLPKINLSSVNVTFSWWQNKVGGITTSQNVMSSRSFTNEIYWSLTFLNGYLRFGYRNGSNIDQQISCTTCYDFNDIWEFYAVTFTCGGATAPNVTFYQNGVVKSTSLMSSFANGVCMQEPANTVGIGGKIGTSFDNNWNGRLDDIMIFNRSLSASEISQLYNSQLTKYDSQNWSFYNYFKPNNRSLNYSYYLCSSNSTTQVCSTQRTINFTDIAVATLTANFSNSIGTINNNFYGTNTHGSWLSDFTGITYNYTWYQNQFLDSNMKIMRADAHLDGTTGATAENTFDSGRIEKYSNLVIWARQNDIKILWVMGYMPSFLANTTVSGATCLNNDNYNKTCPPTNYTSWGNVNVNFLNAIGCDPNVCMVEIWNEPELAQYFLYGIGETLAGAGNRSREYNLIYNASYNAIKTLNSSYQIGGIAYNSIGDISYPILNGFLGNFSNQMDFVSTHRYYKYPEDSTSGLNYYDTLDTRIDTLLSKCTTYSANCSKIFVSEFNTNNATIQNTSAYSSLYGEEFSQALAFGLNNYPANISFINYQFSEAFNYSDTINYPEYPKKWSMLSGPTYDNAFYPPFNVTKNFAHLCPSGGTVYQTNSSDSTIKLVSCKDGNKYNIIAINTGTESRNVSLDLTGVYPYRQLKEYETNNHYLVDTTTNITQLGVLDSYEILYLTGADDNLSAYYKLNENTGTTAYDVSGNDNDGTVSGATWENDGINITLTSGSDYSLSGIIFTLINSDLSYDLINLLYGYEGYDTRTSEGLGSFTDFIPLIVIAIIISIVIFLVLKAFGGGREIR